MGHARSCKTAKTRVPGDDRAQESPYYKWSRLDTPPSRALAPRALRAGGRDRAVLRRLAARGGGQPALSARGLPEHTARGSGGRVWACGAVGGGRSTGAEAAVTAPDSTSRPAARSRPAQPRVERRRGRSGATGRAARAAGAAGRRLRLGAGKGAPRGALARGEVAALRAEPPTADRRMRAAGGRCLGAAPRAPT